MEKVCICNVFLLEAENYEYLPGTTGACITYMNDAKSQSMKIIIGPETSKTVQVCVVGIKLIKHLYIFHNIE